MALWHLRLFGEFCLIGGSTEIRKFETSRSAKLLALLALSHEGRLSRDSLASLLWPEDPPESSRLRLRQEIHRLKKSLKNASDLVETTTNDVWVKRDQLETDLDVLRSTRSNVLPLGEFLSGWDDPWVLPERAAACEIRLQKAVQLGNDHLESGDGQESLRLIQPFVRENPLHEEVRMVAVKAYSQLGKMASAVAEYQDYRRQVRETLGVELDQDLPLPKVAVVSKVAPIVESFDQTIPILTDDTYGRDEEIASIASQFSASSRARLVTLVGPGGVGKTRLAIEVLHHLKANWPGRLAFATLADVANPTDWVQSLATQLNREIPEEAVAVSFLAAELEREPTLLVLDNVETILPDHAADIAKLLRGSPKLKMLATSITPTRVEGEKIISIGPIDPESDGLALLSGAYLEGRDRTITAAIENDLKEIARQLDGYPLALRLAAARLKALSPSDLLEQLAHSLEAQRAHHLPARHRSLQTALTSSIESLDEELLDALERMAFYPGGIGTKLAEIEFGKGRFLDLWEALLDTSLLMLDEHLESNRVRMLMPIRSFVRQRVDAQRAESLERNAAIHSLKLLEHSGVKAGAPILHSTINSLDEEQENIRSAWRYVLQNDHDSAASFAIFVAGYESVRARPSQTLDELIALRENLVAAGMPCPLSLELATVSLCSASYRDDLIPAVLERITQDHPNPDADLAARIAVARAEYAFRKNAVDAKEWMMQALEAASAAGSIHLQGKIHRLLASRWDFEGRFDLTIEHSRKAFDAFVAVGAETELIRTAIYLSAHLWYAGHMEESASTLEVAHSHLAHSRDPLAFAYLNEVIGRQHIQTQNYDEARERFSEALRVWRAMDCDFQIADQLYCLAKIDARTDNPAGAWKNLRESADAWFRDQNEGGLCASLSLLADLLMKRNSVEEASEVVAFARAFRAERGLHIVKSELDLLGSVADQLDAFPTPSHPLTIEGCYRYFVELQ